MVIKSVITLVPVACTIKGFTIVIYEHNGSGQYYKTTITAKAKQITAKASLSQNRKLRSYFKLQTKSKFTIANYDRETFTAQATGCKKILKCH